MRAPEIEGAASGEKRQRSADAEQGERSERAADRQRARARAEDERQQRNRRADGEGEERRDRRAPGRAQLIGIEPELFARERIQRVLRVRDELLGDAARFGRAQALGAIDQRQLLRFGVGIFGKLVSLEADLIFEKLTLRAHRDELAGRHRKCAGGEAGDAGQQHDRRTAARAGDAEDEAGVRHQAVVDAEYRRAQSCRRRSIPGGAARCCRPRHGRARRARARCRAPCREPSSRRESRAMAAVRPIPPIARPGACATPARTASARACRSPSAARARSRPAPRLRRRGA